MALQNLCLSPISVISQLVRSPRLIFYFTWSGINKATNILVPMEVMLFGRALHRILQQVLATNTHLGPVYISKVDLSDVYIRWWVGMEDVPSVAFLSPKKTPSNTYLVGFHLYLPMGYVEIAPYFCMATNTVADLANEDIGQCDDAGRHPLEEAYVSTAEDSAGVTEAQADASW